MNATRCWAFKREDGTLLGLLYADADDRAANFSFEPADITLSEDELESIVDTIELKRRELK